MREAALLGAGMINDVRSLSRDGALQAAAQGNLAVCLMHMQGEPQTMQDSPQYDDVTTAVRTFLADRVAACEAAGIARERLLIDPGFGFAKTLAHNLSLFRHMQALHDLHLPLLVGVSRKSMIGKVLGREVDQRLAGSLALAALAVQQGAHILRVHDVAETVDVLRMLEAVAEAD
jgi:dihydropteroate synthase